MTTLYVLFDHTCGLCTAAARWLREQPAYVKIITIPALSERAALKFPQLGLIPAPRHPASAANFLSTLPNAPAAPAPLTPPTTSPPAAPEQVIVITDEGAVYRGTSAWIMCLWALKKYRAWSVLLATPPWRPRVARIIDGLGRRRLMISRLLMLEAQADARAHSLGDPDCPDGACHVLK